MIVEKEFDDSKTGAELIFYSYQPLLIGQTKVWRWRAGKP
jgi:hypothetical protein